MKVLRGGYTTGSCAAAAAKAAVMILHGMPVAGKVEIDLPDGEKVAFDIVFMEELEKNRARAAVRKSAGDDPDVTDGALIVSEVEKKTEEGISFRAGDGVGIVTLPGLSILPGDPAINPIPREMIRRAIRDITDEHFVVTVSVPDGRKLANKTFNPRLGIVGGLSILGTSGRVVPYSCKALCDALKCSLDIALASGTTAPVFVPGNIGRKAAEKNLPLVRERIVEVSNEWGYMLDLAVQRGVCAVLALGHPGKLAKLAMGYWNTHSKKSPPAVGFIRKLTAEISGGNIPHSVTAEGIFEPLSADERTHVSGDLAGRIAYAIGRRVKERIKPSVVLINMKGEWLGSWGDLTLWKQVNG